MATIFASTEVEYANDKNLQKQEVETLVKWTKEQSHIPDIMEYQAILFLKKCSYCVESAKVTIDTYFTLKRTWADVFAERNFSSSPLLKGVLDILLVSVLPTKNPDGYSVIFMKALSPDMANYECQTCLKLFDCVSVLDLHQKGSSKGHIIVFDLEGFPHEFLPKMDFVPFRKYFYYMQEIMPIVELKAMHFFNPPFFMDEFFNILKSTLPKSLIPSVLAHTSLTSLSKFVPIECLPQDYGGSGPSVVDLQEKMKREILMNSAFLNWEDLQGVREIDKSNSNQFANDVLCFNSGKYTDVDK